MIHPIYISKEYIEKEKKNIEREKEKDEVGNERAKIMLADEAALNLYLLRAISGLFWYRKSFLNKYEYFFDYEILLVVIY